MNKKTILIAVIIFISAGLATFAAIKYIPSKNDEANNSEEVKVEMSHDEKMKMIQKKALNAQSSADDALANDDYDEAIRLYTESRDKYLEIGDKGSANTLDMQIKDTKDKKAMESFEDDEPLRA